MKNWNEIEKVLKQEAQSLNFRFDEAYWVELESQLPGEDDILTFPEEALPEADRPAFEFKDAYWDDVEQMLDKRDRAKRFAFFFRLTGAAAAVGIFVWSVGVWNPSTVKTLSHSIDYQQYISFNDLVVRYMNRVIVTDDQTTLAPLSSLLKEDHSPVSFSAVKKDPPMLVSESNFGSIGIETDSITNAIQQVENWPVLERKVLPFTLQTINKDQIRFSTELDAGQKSNRIVDSKLFLTTGAVIAYAPKGNATEKSLIGWGSIAGVGYQMELRKWTYSAGINLEYRTGLNNDIRYERRYYGARLYTETDLISYKALMRLEFPINAQIKFDKNALGFGITPVYNAGVKSTYQRFNSYNNNNLFVNNNFGIREGVKKYDLKIQLNYARQLTNSLEASGSVSVGLMNQINRNTITNSKGYRDVSIGVSLKYNLLTF